MKSYKAGMIRETRRPLSSSSTLLTSPMFLLIQVWLMVPFLNSASEGERFFRHNQGIASSNHSALPVDFSRSENLLWEIKVNSGHSTPIVEGEKIVLTTFDKENNELATVALHRATGRLLWKRIVPISEIEPIHRVGSPAAPTPATDGENIYVFFGSYGLICYDLDGHLKWSRKMGPFQDEFGCGSSPVLSGDRILINQDHDIDSQLVAIDKSDGSILWRTPRPEAVRSYSTPVVWNRHGRREILVAGALELTSYDWETGSRIWWANGLARIVIPQPVVDEASGIIYMASWAPGGDRGGRIRLESWNQASTTWDRNADGKLTKQELDSKPVLDRFFRMDLNQDGALDRMEWERHASVFQRAQNVVMALKPDGKGNLTESAVLWKHNRGIPYVSSPVLHKGILWMVKDGGIVTKLNATSGQVLQSERLPGRGNYYSSPLVADGKVFFMSEQGVISVMRAEQEWTLLSSFDFDEKSYANPVVDQDRVLIRTEEYLRCFRRHQDQLN